MPLTLSSRLPRVATVLLLGMTVPAVTIPAAHAAPAVTPLFCEGTAVRTFDPPLTNTTKLTNVQATDDFDFCPIGGVTSGDAGGSFSEQDSCTMVFAVETGHHVTVHWSTGASSTVSEIADTAVRLADGSTQLTGTGIVTSGFDQGATAVFEWTLPQLDPVACAGAGVAQLRGPETLTFS